MPVKKFIWDELSDNVLLETDENDVVTAAYHHRPEQFGELLSQHRSGVDRFFHFDGKHSTSDLTASNQKVTDTFSFTAYGEEVTRTGTTTNPFGYKGAVGYYANPVTDDIYVRARTYQPAIGLWLSMDPLGFVDGPNLYRAYFVPNGIDPTGTDVADSICQKWKESSCCNEYCYTDGRWSESECEKCCTGVCPEKACDEICEIAYNDPFFQAMGGGSVFCYDGKKCSCVLGDPWLPIKPGDCPVWDKIVIKHEDSHHKHVECPKTCKVERSFYPDHVDFFEAECPPTKQTVLDLIAAIKNAQEGRCKEFMKRELVRYQEWVDKNCR